MGGSTERPASRRRSSLVRWAAASAALGLLALAGCSAEQVGELQRLGLPEAASVQAPHIGNLWIGTWIAAGCVGVAVWGVIGYVVVKFTSDHNEMPKQNRYNLPMEIFYTTAPFVVIGVLFYYTILAQNAVEAKVADPDVTVDVVGQKWSWTFNYEAEDVAGVNATVWESGTISQTPDLYLPVNETVRFNLRAADVNHSFWVPAFYYKMDLIAGRVNTFDVTPNKVGVFRGKCTELCGTYHSAMLFNVHVVSQAEYEAHLKELAARGQTGLNLGPSDSDPLASEKIHQGEEVGER